MNLEYKDLEKYLSDESFQRWLNGTANTKEKVRWLAWLNGDEKNREIYNEAVLVWQTIRFKKTIRPDIDAAWQRLSQNNGSVSPAPVENINLHRFSPGLYAVLRIAAIIFVLTAAIYFLATKLSVKNQSGLTSVATGAGQQEQINLPDGSRVIINANSVLQFPEKWTSDTNPVYYLEGEAYFIIAEQTNGKICRVFTKDGEVRVLGTHFSVNSHTKETRVSLEKGTVEIITADSLAASQGVKAKVRLHPGQYIDFHNGSKNLRVKEETKPLFVNWWQERFVFKETRFAQIKERLEQTYNLDIQVEDPSLLSRRLSGTIEKNNLNTILQAIALILQTDYHKQGQTVVFNKADNEL